MELTPFETTWIDSPLGPFIAVGNNKALYVLKFFDKADPVKDYIPSKNELIKQCKKELQEYFSNPRAVFHLPIFLQGTPFQKKVWAELRKIPSGETRSYSTIAKNIGNPLAYRAVALACKANKLPIIIPCHRVINENGSIGGYNGGIEKKRWLLRHETQ